MTAPAVDGPSSQPDGGKDVAAVIDFAIESHTATATMNRPPVNALNAAWVRRFGQILDQVEASPDVSVLRLRSGLKVFCAGADLTVMRDLVATPKGRDRMIEIVRGIQDVLFRLERLGAVTIAEIGGAALGGGLELALACDLRVAAETARLGLPEARLGLLPGAGGTQRLPRICGEAVARRLILGAEVVDGREAQRIGLVHWARPAEGLDAWTRDLANRLSESPPQALAACKRCIAASLDPSQNGYELELSETRRLHDIAETQARVGALFAKER